MNPIKQKQDITIQDVWEARKRIKSFVHSTPLLTSNICSNNEQHSDIYLKLETRHDIGAFKVRGAANKILSLTEEQKNAGITTFSTGNHGLAVAWVAKQLGIKAVICISNRVPDAKVNKLEQFGAVVVRVGDSQDDAEQYCYQLEREQGLTVINPFDDREVIAGQGTIGLEIIEDLPSVDTVIIPLSGGGLFSGVALALKSYQPNIKVIGVSMEKSAVMAESLKAGHPVALPEEDTLADSLLGGIGLENKYTFQMVQQFMDDFIYVSEKEIADGMAYLLEQHQLVTEGAAATGVAAILSKKVPISNKTIATIITGQNVDMSVIAHILYKKYIQGEGQ